MQLESRIQGVWRGLSLNWERRTQQGGVQEVGGPAMAAVIGRALAFATAGQVGAMAAAAQSHAQAEQQVMEQLQELNIHPRRYCFPQGEAAIVFHICNREGVSKACAVCLLAPWHLVVNGMGGRRPVGEEHGFGWGFLGSTMVRHRLLGKQGVWVLAVGVLQWQALHQEERRLLLDGFACKVATGEAGSPTAAAAAPDGVVHRGPVTRFKVSMVLPLSLRKAGLAKQPARRLALKRRAQAQAQKAERALKLAAGAKKEGVDPAARVPPIFADNLIESHVPVRTSSKNKAPGQKNKAQGPKAKSKKQGTRPQGQGKQGQGARGREQGNQEQGNKGDNRGTQEQAAGTQHWEAAAVSK